MVDVDWWPTKARSRSRRGALTANEYERPCAHAAQMQQRRRRPCICSPGHAGEVAGRWLALTPCSQVPSERTNRKSCLQEAEGASTEARRQAVDAASGQLCPPVLRHGGVWRRDHATDRRRDPRLPATDALVIRWAVLVSPARQEARRQTQLSDRPERPSSAAPFELCLLPPFCRPAALGRSR